MIKLGDAAFTLALAAGVFGALVAGYGAWDAAAPLRDRLAALVARRVGAAPPEGSPRARQRRAPEFGTNLLKRLVEKLKLTRGKDADKASDLLVQAGYRNREALVLYVGIRLLLPCTLTSLVLIFITPLDLTATHVALIGASVAVGSAYAPPLMLRNMIKKRHQRFHSALPDALDLLMICAESGLGLDGALVRVAREFRRFMPEMADELQLTALELGFLPNRRDALVNLVKRVNIPAMRSLVNTLVQTERYGTPLVQALRVLAAELREERMLKAEEKAAKLPAIMTVPMIIFILPSMFIVLIGPALIQVFKAF
ncbi:MAG: type II secretion system F family protein [Alphaproteobacteria bacterium]|nr:type II secretion system F family protein [Alphaproteobacteria bacterium]